MSDFDHDLYGDLDLEDLDATQLDEELVDPELDNVGDSHADNGAGASTSAPGNERRDQDRDDHGGYNGNTGGGGFDAHAAAASSNNFGMDDRIKPSDMPDEGLVVCGFSVSQVVSLCTGLTPHLPLSYQLGSR